MKISINKTFKKINTKRFGKNRRTKRFLQNLFGGDLEHHTFEGILSIGYEFESNILCKLTLTSEGDEEHQVLLNTDTARKDIELFESVEFDSDDDNLILRQEETVILPTYNNSNLQNNANDVKFYITSDVADSPFKYNLLKFCGDEILNDDMYKLIVNDNNDNGNGKDGDNDEYLLHFIQHPQNLPCNAFTNIEWLFTFYKPATSTNIIMETFSNAMQNLIRHLDELEVQDVQLVYYGDSDGEDKIIGNPTDKKLFHLPGTNLYYLQTELFTKTQERDLKPFTVDDIYIVPQMTFSAHIENIWRIMKSMISQHSASSLIYPSKLSHNSTSGIRGKLMDNYDILDTVKECVDLLIDSYDKGLANNKKIVNYLSLLIYKLYQYYSYLTLDKSERKYLKNLLFFNVRHSNYSLYIELKRLFKLHYGLLNEDDVVKRIIDLIINADILKRYFAGTHRRGVFSRTNFIEKPTEFVRDPVTNLPVTRYGDPAFSLLSYFQFFENPLEDRDVDDHDWLVYREIDSFSQTMDIRDDVLLVEVRSFSKMLSSYLSKIKDSGLKKTLREGRYNTILKKTVLQAQSIGTFRHMLSMPTDNL